MLCLSMSILRRYLIWVPEGKKVGMLDDPMKIAIYYPKL